MLTLGLGSACGSDEANDSGFGSGAPTSTGPSMATASSGGATTQGDDTSTTSITGAENTDAGAPTGEGTGGTAEDPSYPAPVGGACPGGEAVVQLPGASICAPFCAGADAMCPAAATGAAPAECTPFAQQGGSADVCKTHETCPAGEACGLESACVSVAFWGCRLLCTGDTCPDGMVCDAGNVCGYPT